MNMHLLNRERRKIILSYIFATVVLIGTGFSVWKNMNTDYHLKEIVITHRELTNLMIMDEHMTPGDKYNLCIRVKTLEHNLDIEPAHKSNCDIIYTLSDK